ncbi:uncharacterized protein LOC128386329 [Panonychus citri]|uniref:uncharacterized protein LOC128386329 n=1 Tax=Panonychus citri TaxID=50023 RepID=UPI0023070C1E|nr:uncharacterized protein LOC128386329 [Panonychus citri]
MVLQNPETAKQIREIRHLHLLAAKSTLGLDTFLSPSILGFYCFILLENFMVFQDILQINGNPFQIAIRAFMSIVTLVQITYYLVSVNRHASYCYQNVYWLSFKNYSKEAKIEINIFLQQLGPSDIGLSLGKVCLITPEFISNLATLMLSLGLAAPGLNRS